MPGLAMYIGELCGARRIFGWAELRFVNEFFAVLAFPNN